MKAGWAGVFVVAALSAGWAEAAALSVRTHPVGAAVYLRSNARQDVFLGRTDDEGRLRCQVDSGPAQVAVVKDGYVIRVEPLDLAPGGQAHLEVRLVPDVDVPRGLRLHRTPSFARGEQDVDELTMTVLGHAMNYYVEELDPRALLEHSLRFTVKALNALRARETLLRRELPADARLRYYGEEVDLRSYPELRFERGPPSEDDLLSYRLGGGGVAVEGTTDGSWESYHTMLWRCYAFLRHWDTEHRLSHAALAKCLIEGLLDGLDDQHSHFLDPQDVSQLEVENEGHFGGIGILVSVRDGKLTVMSVLPNSPGARARLQPGDWIVEIDGASTLRLGLQESIAHMRGEIGSTVQFTVRRGNGLLSLQLQRAEVELKTTARRMLERGVGYLRVSSFMQEDLHSLVASEVDALIAAGARSLIFDLRNNPGGLLREAHAIADLFLRSGTVVSTRTRRSEEALEATAETAYPTLPLVVLINEGSASAAELLAGSLQEHGRAQLVGVTSYGKGSVQRIYPLPTHGCALSLTIATFHLPSGRTPHATGVDPDVEVELDEESALQVLFRSNYSVEDEPVDAQLAAAIELCAKAAADRR
ncbi:MAG: S41 family peptidase [Planctomycetota bacterium]